MIIDWDRNPKQKELLKVGLAAAQKQHPAREIFYGGGIGGGKTFGVLALFTMLCKIFPNSRWAVFRDTFASHKTKTIPSMEKIIAGISDWHWNKDPANYYVEKLSTGSRIMFVGENIEHDPELGFLQGLEVNGVLLEQTEDLTQKLYERVKSRLGRWVIDPKPTPLLFATFNPTQNWTKQIIYNAYRSGKLPPHIHFIEALTQDNPWNDDEMWENYKRLDPKTYRQMIQGDWTDMTDRDNLWAYCFDRTKHVAWDYEEHPEIWKGNPEEMLILSFDFNRNPMVCSVIQHYDDTVYVLKTYRLPNSNLYELCDRIKIDWPEYMMQVTGDATGRNSSHLVENNMTSYSIIADKLELGPACFKLTGTNPDLKDNRVLVNSILHNYKILIHPVEAEPLIYDLDNVKVAPDGKILKRDRTNPDEQADALDTFRYYCNIFMRRFILNQDN